MKHVLAALVFSVAFLADDAWAACWRAPNGQIIETASNSSPPVARAVRVRCPSPSAQNNNRAPTAALGETILDRWSGANQDNCVLFARSRVPTLPFGLESWQSKLNIRNSRAPRPGSVAIIQITSGRFAENGHVAVVESVTENSITIVEANWGGAGIQRRRMVGTSLADAERRLRISGYFQP